MKEEEKCFTKPSKRHITVSAALALAPWTLFQRDVRIVEADSSDDGRCTLTKDGR